jgi:hypothetical protein
MLAVGGCFGLGHGIRFAVCKRTDFPAKSQPVDFGWVDGIARGFVSSPDLKNSSNYKK